MALGERPIKEGAIGTGANLPIFDGGIAVQNDVFVI